MECSTVARRVAMVAPVPATVLVARIAGVRHVIAAEPLDVGMTIFELDGIVLPTADRYSVQIGRDQHLAPLPTAGPDDDAYIWRYLNHACDPSAAFRFETGADGVETPVRLVATRPLRRGAEVTFDYETTEWDMSVPFRCGCARCALEPASARVVRGYRYLSAKERARLAPHVAPHLCELAQVETTAHAS